MAAFATGDAMRITPLAAITVAALFSAGLTACTYPAIPTPTPAASPAAAAPAPAGPRVPGVFQLDIGQANLRREIELHGIACMLAHFPVDAASAFSDTVREAVAQVVERIEPVSAVTQGGPARTTGGAISVLPSRFSVDVDSDQELFGVTFNGRATLTANVAVDGPGGTQSFAVEGTGTASGRNALIGDCETIATVGRQAVQAALADLGAHLRDQLANTPQIRPAATPPARRARR
jgi:hypothetical protein